jgi:hypothetical protein
MAAKRRKKTPSSGASSSATPATALVRKANALLRRIAAYSSDGAFSQLDATPTEVKLHDAAHRLDSEAWKLSLTEDPAVREALDRVHHARGNMGNEARESRKQHRDAEHARLNALEMKRKADMGSYEKELAILGTGSGPPPLHRRH